MVTLFQEFFCIACVKVLVVGCIVIVILDMACEVLVILVLIILLHIYMGTNIITDLDWLYYRNSDFIVIFGNTTLKYRCGLGNVWQ
jgi:hypothetical protein